MVFSGVTFINFDLAIKNFTAFPESFPDNAF